MKEQWTVTRLEGPGAENPRRLRSQMWSQPDVMNFTAGRREATYCCLVGKTVPESDHTSRDEVSFQFTENTFNYTTDAASKSRLEETPQENDLIPSTNTVQGKKR